MPCRILVADDSTPIQKVIRIAFSKYHVEIATAGSLSEAVREAERLNPELIIADASLPGVAMASDFSRLTSKAPGAATIVLMGTYDAVKESDIRTAGLSSILKKPFDAIELLEASEKLLPGRLKSSAGAITGKDKTGALPPPPSSIPSNPGIPLASQAGIPSFSLDENEPFGLKNAEAKLDIAKKGLPAYESPHAIPTPPAVPGSMFSKSEPQISVHEEFNPANTIPPGSPPQIKRPHTQTVPSQPSFAAAENTAAPTSAASVSAAVEEFVRKELPALVERAVERYCIEHFKGAAREVLTTELRRLAEEKARYLVDQ